MSANSRVVIRNVGTMLVRQFAGIGIALVSTRWLLGLLGEVEYGVLMAVGAGGGLLAAIANALGSATRRHLAYEIGRRDEQKTASLLVTSCVVFLCLSILVSAGALVAMPAILNAVQAPPERSDAVRLVYLIVVGQVAITTASAPLTSYLFARQMISRVAGLQLLLSTWELLLVWSLWRFQGDSLILYASGVLLGRVSIVGATTAMVVIALPTKLNVRQFSPIHAKRIASFAGWSSLGFVVLTIRGNLTNLALNILFGPAINAAFSVAFRGSNLLTTLQQSVSQPVQPAVINACGAGRRAQAQKMALLGSKLNYFISVPAYAILMLFGETLLSWWLQDLPPYSASFFRILCTSVFLQIFCQWHGAMLAGRNRIAAPAAIGLAVNAATFATGIALARLGNMGPPVMVASQTLASLLIAVAYGFCFAGPSLIRTSRWLSELVLPSTINLSASLCVAALSYALIPNQLTSFLVGSLATVLTSAGISFAFGLSPNERSGITRLISRRLFDVTAQTNESADSK
ncbi:lipopolysaccharide biosynthesis protein [Rhodopirellula baltica]